MGWREWLYGEQARQYGANTSQPESGVEDPFVAASSPVGRGLSWLGGAARTFGEAGRLTNPFDDLFLGRQLFAPDEEYLAKQDNARILGAEKPEDLSKEYDGYASSTGSKGYQAPQQEEKPKSWVKATIDGKTYDYSNGNAGGAPKLAGRVGGESMPDGYQQRRPDSYNTPGFSQMEISGNTPGARAHKNEQFGQAMEDYGQQHALRYARLNPHERADLEARSRAKQDPKLDAIAHYIGTPEQAGEQAAQRFVAELRAKAPNQTPNPADIEAARARGMTAWQAEAKELALALASGDRSMFPTTQ